MRSSAIIAAVAAATIGVVGCGSSSGDSNKTLSYSGFATAANKVCQNAQKRVSAVTDGLSGTASKDAPIYDDLIPALEKSTNEFKALKPPAALRTDFDKFVSLTEQQNTAAKAAQAAAKSGDDAAYQQALSALTPLSAQTNLEGSKLGAADCAK